MGHRTRTPEVPQQAIGSPGVVAWRKRQLERAGFGNPLAAKLAADRRVDLHALLELVDRGCAPALAGRILAPLDARWLERP